MSKLLDLPIKSPHHQADGDAIRLRAEGLAREIHNDIWATEGDIANAIESAIRKFAPKGRARTAP
jgi:hypothetical protein